MVMGRTIRLFRKRHIPDELIELKDDEILRCDDEVIITKWTSIHPRDDLLGGTSAFFLKDGYKVSKFYNLQGKFFCWYCDIIMMHETDDEGRAVYEDLLLDVVIYPDGRVEVVDSGEFADALENGLIDKNKAIMAMRSLDKLLGIIYRGEFDGLKKVVEDAEHQVDK